MARWMIATVAVFLLVYSATVIATGAPEYILPVALLAVILLAWGVLNWALTRRIVRRDGSLEAAMSDDEDPVPSAHLIPDEVPAAGDTPEAHDEISPHDLPVDHPGRPSAERRAAGDVAQRPEVVRDDDLRTDRKDGGEGRFARDAVAWTAEDRGRGEIRGRRSSQ